MQLCSVTLAGNSSTSGAVSMAVKKYKAGNYTGCLQDCQSIVKRDPSSAVAYYYMAMSYAQAGKKNEAIAAYSKVLGLKTNLTLSEYANRGKTCLETPEKCTAGSGVANGSDLDNFITAPFRDGLSKTVKTEFEKKRIDSIKNEINSGKDLGGYEFQKFRDYTKDHSSIDNGEKIAQATTKPTNDEIVAAMRVLNDAGLSPYSSANPMLPTQQINPELAQINMLMGNNSNQSSNNGNNAMMNMLPFMMAQGKNGENSYSPQLMQAVLMNSMMPDFNLNMDNNK